MTVIKFTIAPTISTSKSSLFNALLMLCVEFNAYGIGVSA